MESRSAGLDEHPVGVNLAAQIAADAQGAAIVADPDFGPVIGVAQHLAGIAVQDAHGAQVGRGQFGQIQRRLHGSSAASSSA